MFEFLKLLYNNEATYEKVTKLLAVNYDEKLTTAVLLNKYLNTLKVFGIKVEKSQHKYYMQNSPYKLDFDKIDLRAIMLFKNSMNLLTDTKTKNSLELFLKNLFLRFDENAKAYFESLQSDSYKDLSFFYRNFEEQIKLCEKYINDKFKLKLTYRDINGDEKTVSCVPVELKYLKRKICFVVHSHQDGFNIDIPINRIISVKQLPTQSTCCGVSTTIVYKIKGDLAKSYRLKDFETLQNTDEDGNLVIASKGEDFNSLIARLMRYNDNCEIISPKAIKEYMVEVIDKMLSRYDD